MEISIVVPTYNGAHKIPGLLDALLNQTVGAFELIVVIDGSTDNTYELLQKYNSRFSKFRIIKQENKGRAKVRNNGAKIASGELLIFYDDDVEPLPNSVEKHLAFHVKHKDAILGGMQVEDHASNKTDIQNYKATLVNKWVKNFTDGINLIKEANTLLTAANMSIPRELFFRFGGFDERLSDIEDLEFGKRIQRSGVKLYFDKSNKAIHNDPITCMSYIMRTRQYTYAQNKLHGLFPDIFHNRTITQFHRRFFYRLFAHPFWPKLIDNRKTLHVLPVAIRYKIYEWVIFSLGVVFPDVSLDSK